MQIIIKLLNKAERLALSIPPKKMHWGIFLTSIFLAILSGFYYYNEAPYGDALYYFNASKIISTDFWALFTTERIGVIESLNAIFQGIVRLLPGNDFVWVYAMQIIVYALTGLFVFKLSEKFTGRLGALVVLIFYFIQYNHYLYIYNFKPGVWVNFFIILIIYHAYKIIQEPGKRSNYIWIGVLSGLLLLTDLRYVPHLLFMYFIVLFTKLRLSQKIKYIALSVVFLLLSITPWVIRQSVVFDRFILISDLNTLTIHKAFNTPKFQNLQNYPFLAELSDEEFNADFWALRDSLSFTPGELIYVRINTLQQVVNAPDVPIVEKYADIIEKGVYTEEEIHEIIEKRESESSLMKRIRRAAYFWQPFQFGYSYQPLTLFNVFHQPASLNNNLNRIITLGILLPFFLLGCVILIIRKNLLGIILVGFFLSHTFVHALVHVQWRYMLPISPLVTLVAVYGVIELIRYFKNKRIPDTEHR